MRRALNTLFIRLMSYKPIDPPIGLNLRSTHFRDMTKSELKLYHDWFLHAISDRVQELARAVRSDLQFYDWRPDETVGSLKPLATWIAKNVQTRPRTEEEMEQVRAHTQPHLHFLILDREITPRTSSIAFDFGIYLGLVAKRQFSQLHWRQVVKDRRDADFGHMVLDGLGPVPYNPILIADVIISGIARGTKTSDDVLSGFDFWTEQWQSAQTP